MRPIKVWGGTHPNELLGMAVADSLMAEPIPNVSAGIVNLRARELGNLRYVVMNMNDAYPGNPASAVYEETRAPAVVQESLGYFAVVDLHANNHEGGDTAYIGSRGVSPEVLGFLAEAGLKRLVLSSFNSLRQHTTNSFLLDISHTSELADVNYWRGAFDKFANAPAVPLARAADFEWYEYTDDLTVDDMNPRELTGEEMPFGALAAQTGHAVYLGQKPQHWLAWIKNATTGYWAELCSPIPPPDESNWPGFG